MVEGVDEIAVELPFHFGVDGENLAPRDQPPPHARLVADDKEPEIGLPQVVHRQRRLGNRGDHFGGDEAGRHAVDGDALLRHLERQAFRKSEESRFGRRVVRLTDVTRLADNGADVHDAPRAALDHVLEYRLGHLERAREIDVEHLAPVVDAHLPNRFVDGDAGVVHQVIDAAKLIHDFFGDAVAIFSPIDAPLMNRNLRALLVHRARKCFRALFAAAVSGGDRCPAQCQHLRDGRTDTARTTRHQRYTTFEHQGLLCRLC